MQRMRRRQFYLWPDQDRRLRVAARHRGKTESELLREGLDRVLADPPLDNAAWERELTFIDSLIRKGPIKGKRTWKREDLYER